MIESTDREELTIGHLTGSPLGVIMHRIGTPGEQ